MPLQFVVDTRVGGSQYNPTMSLVALAEPENTSCAQKPLPI